jgi:RimJ/RimL family protein N-acetyltransferase
MARHRPRPSSSEALETERLWLRPYQQGDLDLIVALYDDAEVTAFTKLGRRTAAETEHILAGYLAAWRRLGLGMRAMFLKPVQASARAPARAYVGEFGLFAHGEAGGMALRYALAKDYWGRGLATEAARATLDDGFGAKGLERVLSVVQTRNQASVRIMEKLGFQAQRRAMDGESEIIVYSLSRQQWSEDR